MVFFFSSTGLWKMSKSESQNLNYMDLVSAGNEVQQIEIIDEISKLKIQSIHLRQHLTIHVSPMSRNGIL